MDKTYAKYMQGVETAKTLLLGVKTGRSCMEKSAEAIGKLIMRYGRYGGLGSNKSTFIKIEEEQQSCRLDHRTFHRDIHAHHTSKPRAHIY